MDNLQNQNKPEENSEKMEKLEGLLIDCVMYDLKKEDLSKATEHMNLLIALLETKISLLKAYRESE